jgi:2',3'-cyclic-nucleotide 2'-phosphodiesterase (5'-nucleotidase family)
LQLRIFCRSFKKGSLKIHRSDMTPNHTDSFVNTLGSCMSKTIGRKLWSTVLATALVLSACGGTSDAPEAAFTLQLLHISDADGSDSTALNSVANLSGMIQKFRAQYPQQTLTVSSGDNYIPGPRFNAANDSSLNAALGVAEVGRADIAFLNAMGVQASAIGNHELDLGTRQFADMIRSSGAWSGARFPYLAYNVDFAADSDVASLKLANGGKASEQSGKLTGWTVVDVGGQKIGVIGASSPVFANITSPGKLQFMPALTSSEVDVTGLASVIQKGVDEMTAAGINKVVLLAHMQTLAIEKALAQRLKNVDIIVAGGSNTLLSDANDVLRTGDKSAGDYPYETKDAAGQPTVVVNVDADYKYLGRFMAPFDDKGVLMPQRFDSKLSGAWVTSETDDSAGGVTVSGLVTQVRDAIKAVLKTKDGNVFGKTGEFLEGRRAAVRNEETNFGNLTADANLWYAQRLDPTVQISLKNGGGIRSEIGEVLALPGATSAAVLTAPKANLDAKRQAGEVSQLAVETALKFNNKLWAFNVTATQLKSLLEHGVAVLGSQGRFPQVGGMSFSYDPSRTAQALDANFVVTTAGERIRSLKVGSDVVVQNGVLVGNAQRTFRMVTLDFLAKGTTDAAGGGDSYPFPATADFVNLVDLKTTMTEATAGGAASTSTATLGSEQDAFMKYMKSQFGTTAFGVKDTPSAQDTRIQNLSQRSDTVLN